MIRGLVARYVGDRLPGRRQDLQRLGDINRCSRADGVLHYLGRNERRLTVHVQGEDVAPDEQDPVDVLEEVGEEVVHLGAALAGQALEVSVQPGDPVLQQGDQGGQGRLQALPAQRPHRAQGVLAAHPVRLLVFLNLLGGATAAPDALWGSQMGLKNKWRRKINFYSSHQGCGSGSVLVQVIILILLQF